MQRHRPGFDITWACSTIALMDRSTAARAHHGGDVADCPVIASFADCFRQWAITKPPWWRGLAVALGSTATAIASGGVRSMVRREGVIVVPWYVGSSILRTLVINLMAG